MRVVFMGTPDFAVPSLKMVAGAPDFEVAGVITQPPRPRGRSREPVQPPVKELADKLGIATIQPRSVNDAESVSQISDWAPDVIAVVAFGQILKKQVLELPVKGCINVHASLLPKYRGAAPIHWAVINGETTTGITTMFMDEGLDTGDIILQKQETIGSQETTGELQERLANLGGYVLVDTLKMLAAGKGKRSKQDGRLASWAPPLKREDELIDWDRGAEAIINHVRGMNPQPGAYTLLEGKVLKIWSAVAGSFVPGVEGKPGTVAAALKGEGFVVQTGSGQLVVQEVQLQGRPRMAAAEFLRGHPIRTGQILGSMPGDCS